ncbi:MAG: helix-turn-helix domain-containing protein, partial [Geminicoccaceae bacterium]
AAGLALRRLRTEAARAALSRAEAASRQAGIAPLTAEVEDAARALSTPVARLVVGGTERLLLLAEVEALQEADMLVVDACRHLVRDPADTVALVRRPVLFALLRVLADGWPGDASRELLIRRAFGGRQADESHRARLRVEIGRLRDMLRPLAGIDATAGGFALAPARAREVVVLAQPVETDHAAVLALLADGEAWASSAVALALGISQRTVQRALEALAAEGRVQSFGRGRARRWLTPPVPGFPTALLLPALVPGD